jgi:hypothetical protein
LEHGLLEALEYFDSKSLRVDASVFSAIVRLHAREYLRGRQLNADAIESVDMKVESVNLKVESVNLCGLWLKIGRYHLKIWKISVHDLAKALERQNAVGQQLSLVDQDGIPIAMNLAVYWTADAAHKVGQLYLVQPKQDDPRCYEWAWSREIKQQITAEVPAVDAGDIAVEELTVDIQSEK